MSEVITRNGTVYKEPEELTTVGSLIIADNTPPPNITFSGSSNELVGELDRKDGKFNYRMQMLRLKYS
jgi:hypothetical protein